MSITGRFATGIACMDGRFIARTSDQLLSRFGVRQVDLVTGAGPVKDLADDPTQTGEGLLENVVVSMKAHDSRQVGIVAHGDCAGNPVSDQTQRQQLAAAAAALQSRFPDAEVMALFLDPRTGFDRVV